MDHLEKCTTIRFVQQPYFTVFCNPCNPYHRLCLARAVTTHWMHNIGSEQLCRLYCPQAEEPEESAFCEPVHHCAVNKCPQRRVNQ